MRPSSVSVVLPTLNESEGILKLIESIKTNLGASLLEIVIVDDDSPDRTWEVIERLGDPICKVIRRIGCRGLASAIAQGAESSLGEVILISDADFGISPSVMPRLVQALERCDIAVGSRYVESGSDERPWLRAMLSRVFNAVASLMLDRRFHDYTSGFVAFRRRVLEKAPIGPEGYGDYFMDWIVRALKNGYVVCEVGYAYGLRTHGVSKTDSSLVSFLKICFQYIRRLFKIKFSYST